MAKILSFDEAYEYVLQLDEAGEQRPGFPDNQSDNQMDMYDDLDFGIPDDAYEDFGKNIEDASRMMENFESYLRRILSELRDIIDNHPEELEEVELEFELLADNGTVCQLYIVGSYKGFGYEHILVTPTRDWNNDRERLIKYIKAIVVREYNRI